MPPIYADPGQRWRHHLWRCALFVAAVVFAAYNAAKPAMPFSSKLLWLAFFAVMTMLMLWKTYRVWRETHRISE
jgi:tellurite resistance protein TehA-like permease